MTLFDAGAPEPRPNTPDIPGCLERPRRECRWCQKVTWWLWCPVAEVWLCDGYSEGAEGCGKGQGHETVERDATPVEVDAGCELGVAYDIVPVGGRREGADGVKDDCPASRTPAPVVPI